MYKGDLIVTVIGGTVVSKGSLVSALKRSSFLNISFHYYYFIYILFHILFYIISYFFSYICIMLYLCTNTIMDLHCIS